jgi:hypothetical protein
MINMSKPFAFPPSFAVVRKFTLHPGTGRSEWLLSNRLAIRRHCNLSMIFQMGDGALLRIPERTLSCQVESKLTPIM